MKHWIDFVRNVFKGSDKAKQKNVNQFRHLGI